MGNPARDGWTFIGWAKTREATTATTKYQARGTLPFEKSLALYAVWEWNIAGNKYWTSIAISDNGDELAAGIGVGGTGHLYTSSNSGATWQDRNTGATKDNPIAGDKD